MIRILRECVLGFGIACVLAVLAAAAIHAALEGWA